MMKRLRIVAGILVMALPIIALFLSPLWEDIFQFDFIGWSLELGEELFGDWSVTMGTLIEIIILSIFVIIGFLIATYPWVTPGEEIRRRW